MKKNVSKATKAGSKNSQNKTPHKKGRGGARPGAGRKAKPGERKSVSIDVPEAIIKGMTAAGINNKTAYFNYLAAIDLLEKDEINFSLQKELNKIVEDVKKTLE